MCFKISLHPAWQLATRKLKVNIFCSPFASPFQNVVLKLKLCDVIQGKVLLIPDSEEKLSIFCSEAKKQRAKCAFPVENCTVGKY